MFEEISNNELFSLDGGGIFADIGYMVGRLIGEITKAVVSAPYHPSYPCGGDCCNTKYYN